MRLHLSSCTSRGVNCVVGKLWKKLEFETHFMCRFPFSRERRCQVNAPVTSTVCCHVRWRQSILDIAWCPGLSVFLPRFRFFIDIRTSIRAFSLCTTKNYISYKSVVNSTRLPVWFPRNAPPKVPTDCFSTSQSRTFKRFLWIWRRFVDEKL